MSKKKVLGRGLDALITFDDADTQGSSSINEVPLSQIIPNPDQPRQEFSQEALEELSDSIKKIGVIQPVTLRKIEDNKYQIIAGERRYRASRMAGLESIPAYIKTADDDEIMEMALIENIQREDLNSIEIALAYQKLINTLSLTQEQLSQRVGKKRATITNYLRLLKLPAEVQMGVKDKKVDMGHARALITMNDPVAQLSLYNMILKEGLSVRKVESIAKEHNQTEKDQSSVIDKETAKSKTQQSIADDFDLLKRHLTDYFQTDVKFSYNKNGTGKITIPFDSAEDLERIMVMFDKIKKG